MKKRLFAAAAVSAFAVSTVAPIFNYEAFATPLDNACDFQIADMGGYESEFVYNAGAEITKTLQADSNGLVVRKGANVVLDINGFTMRGALDYDGTRPTYPATAAAICVEEGGKLTLKGSGVVNHRIMNFGEMTIDGDMQEDGKILNAGTMVIENTNYTSKAIQNGYRSTPVSLTINGGTFKGRDGSGIVVNDEGGSLEINGGSFENTGIDSIIINKDTTKINGGSFKTVGTPETVLIENYDTGRKRFIPKLTITDGLFEYKVADAPVESTAELIDTQVEPERVGECTYLGGEAPRCETQISGGYYRYFVPSADFFVEGYKGFEVDADTVQVRDAAPAPEEPKEDVKNPNTFDGLTGLISALSISFISGFGLVNFLKNRR